MPPTRRANGPTASLPHGRRAPRAHEWSRGKIVTFIVTLAATRCVTLAAREAGMSRKSAYALKSRDERFADAWEKALGARAKSRRGEAAQGVQTPADPAVEGNSAVRAARSTWSTSPTANRPRDRREAEAARDRFFARLAAARPAAPPPVSPPSGPPSPASRRGRP